MPHWREIPGGQVVTTLTEMVAVAIVDGQPSGQPPETGVVPPRQAAFRSPLLHATFNTAASAGKRVWLLRAGRLRRSV